MLSSNFGRDPGCVSSVPPGKFRSDILIKLRPFLFNHFPIHQSSVIKNPIIRSYAVLRMTESLQITWEKCQHLEICDDCALIQILCLYILPIFLLLIKKQRFGDWILSPSSQTFRSYLYIQYGPGIYPKFRKHLKTETESSLRNVAF
jgi:hypothetical protein